MLGLVRLYDFTIPLPDDPLPVVILPSGLYLCTCID